MGGMSIIGKSTVDPVRVNLYELFELHIKARGEFVDSKEDADINFGEDGDVQPSDISKIISEYL